MSAAAVPTALPPASPRAMLASGWRNRHLIGQLARRDIQGRYRGSALGIVWSLLHPILMLAVYTFVFSVVFATRWPGLESEGRLHFAIVLFAGMIVFGIFSESVQRAPTLIVGQPNFVKKIVFPLEIMPWVTLVAALFHAAIGFVVLLVLLAFAEGSVPLTVFLLPLVLVPLVALCLGLAWFLASLGVFLRDVGQMIGVAVTALMFLSPLFYPSSALPEKVRWLVALNPLALPIELARSVIVFGRAPDWGPWLVHLAASVLVMWLGFAWFQRTRRAFADVI